MSTKPSHFFFYPHLSTTLSTNPSLSNIPKQPSPAHPAYWDVIYSGHVFYTSPQPKHFFPLETYSFVWVFILWPLFAISCRYLSFHALIIYPTFPYPHYMEIAFKAGTSYTSNSINSTEYPMCVWVQGWMLSHLPLRHHPLSSTSSGTLYALSMAPVNEWVSDQSEINSNILSSRWTSPNRLCFRHTSSLFAGEQAKLNSKTSGLTHWWWKIPLASSVWQHGSNQY